MFRFFAVQLLLIHAIQGLIHSSALKFDPLDGNELRDEFKSELRAGYESHNNVNSKENNQSKPTARQSHQGIMSGSGGQMLSPQRQRRHIGSIAAFRGLPALPYNRFNSHEWSAQMNPDRLKSGASEEMGNGHYSLAALPNESEVSPFKRHPVSSAEENDMNNPLEREDVGNRAKLLPEIITFPNNEARTRAVARLLRLFSEAKMDPRRVGSISKKFIGALARNNGLPPPMKQASNIQYRGSLAIPLPGKRSFDRSAAVENNFVEDKHALPDYLDMVVNEEDIE